MALHELGYRHWQGRHQGIWYRRWTIAGYGLKAVLANRWMRYLLTVAWVIALVQVAVLFSIAQLLVEDSLIVRWTANFEGLLGTLASSLTQWLEQHPEISVRTAQNLIFYNFNQLYLTVSLLAVTLVIPHLITRDLSSNAILVYTSKALNRTDYLAGKLGILLGILSLVWLGPMVAAWFLGNLLAPDWHFFWHARVALLNSLLFVGCSMLVLGFLGLATSAISSKEKAAVGLWLLLWLVGNAFVPIARENRQLWLQHFSFHHNLQQLSESIHQPKTNLEYAITQMPVLGDLVRRTADHQFRNWQPPRTRPAAIASAIIVVGAGAFLIHRTRTE